VLILANGLWDWRERRKTIAQIRRAWGDTASPESEMTGIASYHDGIARRQPDSSIDDRTWRDLDLDAVYEVLDRATSRVGQQLLYHRLRSRRSVASLAAFDALASQMSVDTARREKYQLALASLRRPAAFDVWQLAEPGALNVTGRDWFSPAVALIVLTSLVVGLWWPASFLITIGAIPGCLWVRLLNMRRVSTVIDTFRQIGPLISTADILATVVDDQNADLTRPLIDDAPCLTRLRVVAGWVARDSVTMDPISGALFELVNFFLALDGNALLFGALELRGRAPALERVITAVGEVDAAIAIASYRRHAVEWTRPCFQPVGSPVAIQSLRHPLLPNGVDNSVQFAPPHGVLITGSNMSGKSTFLRSIGVAAVMSQAVYTCTAKSYSCPMLSVRSCMGRSDDLASGRSYYLDEVQGILSLVRAGESTDVHIFLLDEIFRGTNAVERIAAGVAALAHLVGSTPKHLVIAATHDGELVSLLESTFSAFHFSDHVDATGLVFDYRLTEGPSTTQNAVALLELHGAPSAMIDRAKALVEQFRRR
jgi:hypothetical protein